MLDKMGTPGMVASHSAIKGIDIVVHSIPNVPFSDFSKDFLRNKINEPLTFEINGNWCHDVDFFEKKENKVWEGQGNKEKHQKELFERSNPYIHKILFKN